MDLRGAPGRLRPRAADPPLDPLGDPDGSREHLRTADAVGATAVNASLVATSAAHHLAQMAALRELTPERFETNAATT